MEHKSLFLRDLIYFHFLAAMYEKNGLPFEKVVKTVIKSRFLRPKVRPYKTENLYEYAEKQYDLEKEVKSIVEDN